MNVKWVITTAILTVATLSIKRIPDSEIMKEVYFECPIRSVAKFTN
jgi:hypothetical protein